VAAVLARALDRYRIVSATQSREVAVARAGVLRCHPTNGFDAHRPRA
jgi:hypothetical protein